MTSIQKDTGKLRQFQIVLTVEGPMTHFGKNLRF